MPPRAGPWDLSSLERLTRQDTYQAYIGSSAEIGALSRFQTARELTGYLGLVPSESSTGDTVNRGGITKAGNGRARRILVEAAWSYRYPPRVSCEKQIKVAAAPRAGARDCLESHRCPVDGGYDFNITLQDNGL
jgi:hypothetical protein